MKVKKGKSKEALLGKGKAVFSRRRLQGKDAKLAAMVRDADRDGSESDKAAAFDAKKIGKKPVFRPILTSPFSARWPAVSPVHLDAILHALVNYLESSETIGYLKREDTSTQKTPARTTKERNKKRKTKLAVAVLEQHGIYAKLPSDDKKILGVGEKGSTDSKVQSRPIMCGLNSVTRQMETMIKCDADSHSTELATANTKHTPTIIFVCQNDVDPPMLVSHFPLLTSTYNAISHRNCYLIRLPKGAEHQLSQATGLRRCSVLSIDHSQLKAEGDSSGSTKELLLERIKKAGVEAMRMDWMDKAVESIREQGSTLHLMEPHIKHLRSSAPLDLNTLKVDKRTERIAKRLDRKKRKEAQSLSSGKKSQARKGGVHRKEKWKKS
ncbi:hypothetical protein CBS101457_003529 [Exobasidium rhododendri]|nr:hypothetical protein CBS101457_003529 [Exobasidium rhododendri]